MISRPKARRRMNGIACDAASAEIRARVHRSTWAAPVLFPPAGVRVEAAAWLALLGHLHERLRGRHGRPASPRGRCQDAAGQHDGAGAELLRFTRFPHAETLNATRLSLDHRTSL